MVVAVVAVKERALPNIPDCNNNNIEQKMKTLIHKKICNHIKHNSCKRQKSNKIVVLKQAKNKLKLEL